VFSLDLSFCRGGRYTVKWFDPRKGVVKDVTDIAAGGVTEFSPPGTGDDWVLILYAD